MKRIRKILLLMMMALLLQGCVTNNNKEDQLKDKLITKISSEKSALVEQQVKEDNITINLHHVIFDEKYIIVDYTLEADNIEDYGDITVSCIGEVETEESNSILVEEKDNTERRITYIRLKENTLSSEDVGKKVQIQFYSAIGIVSLGENENINIPVEITKVYKPEHIEVQEEADYGEGMVVIESIDVSKFYTDVNYSAEKDSFMMGLYGFEITDEKEDILQMIFGNEKTYSYMPLSEKCKCLGVTAVKYKEDNSYEKIGSQVMVEIK